MDEADEDEQVVASPDVAVLAERPTGNLVLTGNMHALAGGFVQDSYGMQDAVDGQDLVFEVMASGVSSTGLFFAATALGRRRRSRRRSSHSLRTCGCGTGPGTVTPCGADADA